MRRFMSLGLASAAAMLLASAAPAEAATPNLSVAIPGVEVLPITINGQRTANVTSIVKFKLPFAAKLIGVSTTARASGGTTPTLTVDVLDGGTSVLSAPIAVTAGTVAEGTIATATLADEDVITVNLAITGTNPTWDDITILLTVVRN